MCSLYQTRLPNGRPVLTPHSTVVSFWGFNGIQTWAKMPIAFTKSEWTCLKCNTYPADRPLPFPAHRPVPMCRAYRCTCTHLRPWRPFRYCCRAGSGRSHSQTSTGLWPCEGRVSSCRHTEPPSPALIVAATGKKKGVGQGWGCISITLKTDVGTLMISSFSFTFCFMTPGNERMESAQLEYFSQFEFWSPSCMAFSVAICWTLPPLTSILVIWFVFLLTIFRRFAEMMMSGKRDSYS